MTITHDVGYAEMSFIVEGLDVLTLSVLRAIIELEPTSPTRNGVLAREIATYLNCPSSTISGALLRITCAEQEHQCAILLRDPVYVHRRSVNCYRLTLEASGAVQDYLYGKLLLSD